MVSALKSNNYMMREVLEVFQRGILENNRQPLKDIMEIISLDIQSEQLPVAKKSASSS